MSFIQTPINPGVYMIMIIAVFVFAIYVSILFLFRRTNECLFHRILAILTIGIVVYLSVHRDTFLPFLGKTVFPFTLVKDSDPIPNGNVSTTVYVDAPNDTKIAYWAAMPNSTNKVESNPQIAYDNYINASVTSVKNGQATLTIYCPAQYKVPMNPFSSSFNKTLEKHIHYRIIYTNGMISQIYTKKVKC